MRLFVIRHAVAVEAAGAMSDEARPLSAEGRAKFVEIVRGLRRIDTRLDSIVHSPLLRAVQTAELLTPLLSGTSRVSARLAEPPSAQLLEELRGENVAVVGHEPWVSELVSSLTLGNGGYGHVFTFKKGGVAILEGTLRPGEMTLAAFLPPTVARELGR